MVVMMPTGRTMLLSTGLVIETEMNRHRTFR